MNSAWDHSTDERFYDYYAKASQSAETLQRFRSIRNCVLRIVADCRRDGQILQVADIGCGAGTQSMMWAELGHRVHGLDVNQPLIELAKERSVRAGYTIDFQAGAASELPWPDASMDVCLVPELLEHVAEWKRCLEEFARILRPGGILFLTTTNKLCPVQNEFNLPLYSWYPAPLKRRFERLVVTTRPELANFARYPAVNWFSFYGLRSTLSALHFRCLDRFDVMDLTGRKITTKVIVTLLRSVALLRWLAHIATPGTIVLAIKGTGMPGPGIQARNRSDERR